MVMAVAFRDSRTRMVDLGGRALLPGFIDPHMHFSFVIFDDAVLAKLKEAAQRTKPGDWVRGKVTTRASSGTHARSSARCLTL